MVETIFFWSMTAAISAVICFYLLYKTQMKGIQMVCLVVCLVGGAYLLYHYLGRSKMLATYYSSPAKQARQTQKQIRPLVTQMTRRITQLEFKVAQDQTDLRSWWQLGQLYQLKRDLANAKRAFAQAVRLAPENLNLQAQYASSCAQFNGGRLDPKTHRRVLSILAQAPQHDVALNLLALDAYQSGHFKQAIEHWQTILNVVKEDPKKQQITMMVQKMIQKAKQRSN